MKAGSVQASFMGHCFPDIGKNRTDLKTEDTYQALICLCIPKMNTLASNQVIGEDLALRVEVGRFGLSIHLCLNMGLHIFLHDMLLQFYTTEVVIKVAG